MNNIIVLGKYNRRKRIMEINELLKWIEERNRNGEGYSKKDIIKIADEILDEIKCYSRRGATPIVKIARQFDFKTYKETLSKDKSGDIYVNGDTEQKYQNSKVIIVNNKEDLFHLRFVIAHELAHYLFDFLGNDKYEDTDITFTEPYTRDQHETEKEKRANVFAAELMMPEELFVKQYDIAKSAKNNHVFIVTYLSRFFETSIDSIERRIKEVVL